MRKGAIIENGLADFEIIQQINGLGTISLFGIYLYEGEAELKVHIRLVREDTGSVIIPWTQCQHTKEGKWNVTLKNIPAGGLYRIETYMFQPENRSIQWGIRGDMRHHIGVGDVYIIAGQSNSAGYGREPVNDPPEMDIHLLRNNGRWDIATHPMNDSTDTLHVENMEGGNSGHCPYLNFARIIKKEMGYPIGLIQASLGGSTLSAWNPDEEGILYRNMLNIINNIYKQKAIKGVLWYQGCSEAMMGKSDLYYKGFSNFVFRLRRDLEDNDLPFFTVQLNRYTAASTEETDRSWGKLREAQRQAAKKIKGVYIVPSIDAMLSDPIHNSSNANMMIGERIASIALKYLYKRGFKYEAPDLKNAKKVDLNNILLTFDNVNNRLNTYEVLACELPFRVEDSEGFIDVESYQQNSHDSILLTLKREIKGKAFVHGAYEQNPGRFIPFDFSSNLPMLSFYGEEVL